MFLNYNSLVIEIGDFTLKIAFFNTRQNKLHLDNLIIKKIVNIPQKRKNIIIQEALTKNFTTAQLVNSRVFFVLPDRYFVVRQISMPDIPAKELRQAVKYRLKNDIPWDIEDTFYIWNCFRHTKKTWVKETDSKNLNLLIVCTLKKDVYDLLHFARDNGLSCWGVYPQIFCLGRGQKMSNTEDRVAVLDIGGVNSFFNVYNQGRPLFTRKLPFRLERIDKMISEGLKKDGVSAKDITQIKHQYGLGLEQERIDPVGVSGEKYFAYFRDYIERLIVEIKRSLEYYYTEFGGDFIEKIYLAGGGGKFKGFAQYIQGGIGIEVKSLSAPSAEVLDYKISDEQHLIYVASLLGAAKEDEHNLLPKKVKQVTFLENFARRLSVFVPVLTGIIILMLGLFGQQRLRSQKQRLRSQKIEAQSFATVKQTQERVKRTKKVIDSLREGYIPAIWILKALSFYLPSEAAVTSVSFKRSRGEILVKGYLAGASKPQDVITQYANKMKKIGSFEDINITTSRLKGEEVSPEYGVEFEFNSKIKKFDRK